MIIWLKLVCQFILLGLLTLLLFIMEPEEFKKMRF